jgi:integrase/recombinase XerD
VFSGRLETKKVGEFVMDKNFKVVGARASDAFVKGAGVGKDRTKHARGVSNKTRANDKDRKKHVEVKAFPAQKALAPLTKALSPEKRDSLQAWILLYFKVHVMGAPLKTQQAKQRDLERFMRFFEFEVGHDHLDGWTPAVTKHFQQGLTKTVSVVTGKAYSETTINRVLATLRHFGRWLHQQRPLLAGDPFKGVKDRQVDEPDWNGLTARQVLRLKAACEQRIKACGRTNQNPLLETAVFYLLLQTGLRESEIVSLDVRQYHHKGLHRVVRHKNKRVSNKVPVPQEAREALERYLESRGNGKIKVDKETPLFLSRYGNRLATQDVRRICQRLLKQGTAFLGKEEKFRFTPHMLRHTFLKQVTDKHGVHFAQQMSGNVSIREIFRYAKPSQQEIDETVEGLFQ